MDSKGPRAFVNLTSLEPPDRGSTRNARKYVRQGKNCGQRRKQPSKRSLASWINGQFPIRVSRNSEPVSNTMTCTNQVPRQVASEWSIFRFAEEIGPHMRQQVYQFFPILEQTSFPNRLLAGNVFDRQAPLWFEHLRQSQTYVHNQIFVTMAYSDMIVNRVNDVGRGTISHMTKALRLLQTDLATNDRATSEATISTIIAFSMVAFISGDMDTAENHLRGLFRVLDMRGGIVSLRSCTYLQMKSCRLDLSHAMCTGSKPLFFTCTNISWTSYLPRSLPSSQTTATAIQLLLNDDSDPKLISIWSDLHEFSRAANIAAQTGRKLEPDLPMEVMISVQYRLLNLKYDDDDDIHELLRIVLLGYSTTILPLLYSQFGATPCLSYPSLNKYLQSVTITLVSSSNEKLKAHLWLLVIVGISVLDTGLTDLALELGCTIRALGLE